LLGGHVLLMRHLIELPAVAYSRTLIAGIGPVPFIVVGLLVLERVTRLALPGALHLVLLALVALALHWAYLQWVLRVRFGDLLPKRRQTPVPAEPAK
jgi:hypothetical protein